MTARLHTAPSRINGIVVGGLCHQILLALRGVGGMTTEQLYARFEGGWISQRLTELRRASLIEMPDGGGKGKPVRLTDAGRRLVDPDGPLARRKTLTTYCQL
jgi:hypothetical protein